jgi:formylglycine-generating enzyme required for sulfatase activity
VWRCNIAAGRTQEAWGLDGYGYASPVGSYSSFTSPYGLHDTSGNVWEWCLDWYRADAYSKAGERNPTGPEEGKQRVLRGGSFANDAKAARAANRTAKVPDYREASVGFRCVRVVERSRRAEQVDSDE